MKKTCGVYSALLLLAVVISGCNVSEASEKSTVVKLSQNEDRKQAFTDLNVVSVLDFDLTWRDADETELFIWAEQYKDGRLDPEQIISLSTYSEETKENGNIGMGIADVNSETPMVVLYAPGSAMRSELENKLDYTNAAYGWEAAIGEESLKVEEGKTYLLGVYRVSDGLSIASYDLQNEGEVERMIKDDRTGFLLKMKVEKKEE